MRKWIAVLFFLTLGFAILVNSCQDSNAPYQVYSINQTKCTQCHLCLPKCGFGAITYTPVYNANGVEISGKVTIDSKKCVGCGECYIACPYGAISSEGSSKVDGTTGATRSN